MGLIKIFFGDIELDYKKDTLSLKRENNALSTDFTATYSSFPFLIIENEKSLKALGSSDIRSINKKKVIPVTIISFGIKFYGELQQLSVINGYRKCNLKCGSDILKIISKKISDYMPVVSVIPGEINPIPFNQDSNTVTTANDSWKNYPVPFIGKYFPEVKWQFPTMNWKNKYGENLSVDDKWYQYAGMINKFILDSNGQTIFRTNYISLDATNNIVINNINVAAPQIFLLSPLHYFTTYLGYKYVGDFTTNSFIKRLLFLSTKDNLVDSYVNIQHSTAISLGNVLTEQSYNETPTGPISYYYYHALALPTPKSGKYIFSIKFTEPLFITTNVTVKDKVFQAVFKGLAYGKYSHSPGVAQKIYQYDFSVDIVDSDIGEPIYLTYQNLTDNFPVYEINYRIISVDNNYKKMHPTIETGRYLPDWTVGNYLNYLKNQFNLDITIDDFKKEISLNLNETNQDSEVPVVIEKSLVLKSYDLAANSSFIIKYANSEDTALYITNNQEEVYTTQGDDFTQKIQSEFKLVPHNGTTSELSSAVEDKDGVGLLLYDTPNAPFTVASYNGLNMNIDGAGGIYQTYWKRWIKFLLNASNCQITGYFTDIEIARIYTAKSVYIDNQRYRIVSIEFSEASNNYRELVMELSSVNY
jgi:hypothetical protein